MRPVAPHDRLDDLVVAIDKTGYYPQVVAAGVRAAVAGEEVVSFLVHHEPTIDRDEVRRHITVVVLTSTRLILCHTDEHAPDDLLPEPYTSTSTEAIRLAEVRSVVVNRMVANPATFDGGGEPTPSEAVVTVGGGNPDGRHPGPLRRWRGADPERGRRDRGVGRCQPHRPRAGRVLGPRLR